MSAILNVEVKPGSARTVAGAVLQSLKSVVPAALLVSVGMLGLGGPNAVAQTRQAATLEVRPYTAPTKIMTLPGRGAGEQPEVSPDAKSKATLNYPYGMAVDGAGNLYVANVFGGVNIYSAKGFKLTNTITAGLSYPAAVAIAFGGNIYVANNGGDDITIYNPALAQVGTITDSTLYSPDSMYIDGNNDIWVLDATGTLHVYLDNGAAAGSVATGGTAVGPWGPYVTVWGVDNGPGSYSEVVQNVGEALHYGPDTAEDVCGRIA